jgi:hypothetical protein
MWLCTVGFWTMSDIIDDDKVETMILNSEANGFFVVVLPFFYR